MSIDLGYTIQGHGGQALFWLDNTGGVPWSALASYNFALLPNAQDDWASTTSGSFVLSTPFSVASGQKLTVIANVMTAHTQPYFDVGFALLVSGTQIVDVLFAVRPDNVRRRGDQGSNVDNAFAVPAAGVTVAPTLNGVAYVELGGVTYGPPVDAGGGTVSTLVTTVCSPDAGTNQLLFGMFAMENEVNLTRPAALVVQYVDLR
jgi:hypothetical protein